MDRNRRRRQLVEFRQVLRDFLSLAARIILLASLLGRGQYRLDEVYTFQNDLEIATTSAALTLNEVNLTIEAIDATNAKGSHSPTLRQQRQDPQPGPSWASDLPQYSRQSYLPSTSFYNRFVDESYKDPNFSRRNIRYFHNLPGINEAPQRNEPESARRRLLSPSSSSSSSSNSDEIPVSKVTYKAPTARKHFRKYSQAKSQLRCWHCYEIGHRREICPHLRPVFANEPENWRGEDIRVTVNNDSRLEPTQGTSTSSYSENMEPKKNFGGKFRVFNTPFPNSKCCSYCKDCFHLIKACPVLRNIICKRCGRKGHNEYHCPNQKRGEDDEDDHYRNQKRSKFDS